MRIEDLLVPPEEPTKRILTKVVNLYRQAYDVYIGRAGRGQEGYFGNPYAVGDTCARCKEVHLTGGSTLACYEAYFLDRVNNDLEFQSRVLSLRGKVLGCFCKPSKPCHGDIIAGWLNALESE